MIWYVTPKSCKRCLYMSHSKVPMSILVNIIRRIACDTPKNHQHIVNIQLPHNLICIILI